MFLEKGVLKICSKLTGEHPCQSVVSLKLLCNFIEITLWHGCSVNLLHIFRTPFTKNTSGCLLLIVQKVFEFEFDIPVPPQAPLLNMNSLKNAVFATET